MAVITKRDLRWFRDDPETLRHPDTRRVRREFYEALGWEGGRVGDHRSYSADRRQIDPAELSIRELFEELVTDDEGKPIGRELVESFSPRKRGRNDQSLLEAPVSTAAFANISGQIFFTSTLESFNQPELIGTRLVRTVPTDLQEEEKIPGISLPGDEAEGIGENQPYPEVGLSEEWIMTPEKIKNGYILPVSKEAVFGDRTGLLLQRANTGAQMMAVNKEKRILDAVLGITTLYRRNGGTAQATYANAHTDGDFDNLDASALVDWTDLESALLLFDAITDPNTGEPIMVMPRQLVVPTALLFTAQRILNATEVEHVDNQAAASTIRTRSPNPVGGRAYEILSNQYVKSRTNSATNWFIGDFPKGFTYRENWPITTEEQREGSERAFSHDTVARFKVSEKGTPAVEEPRYGVQGNS